MLDEGSLFPDFSLPDQDGNPVTLKDLVGAPTVVYFYPKDDTTGCTLEACEFQERLPSIPGVRVVGISPDPPAKHRKFRAKYNLEFTLLADDGHKFVEQLGLWVEKKLYGRPYMGVARTTVLLNADGTIKRIWRNVNPKGHAEEVLGAL